MINNKQEYILCAAIWYKDLPVKRYDLLKLARPKNLFEGIVFCGRRHPNCLYQMVSLTGLRQCDAGEEVQGFLTSHNNFLDRVEAGKLALRCGQIDELQFSPETGELFSEDLY